jgi:hypothetical protein
LRRALGRFERFPVRRVDSRLGALVDGIEGLEMDHFVALQFLRVLRAAEYCQIDGVVILRAQRQRRTENDLIGSDALDAEGLAQRQLVLGQRAGLVGGEDIHAGQLLDRRQPGDDRFLCGQQARPDGHGHRQHRRHRHRNRGHGQHQDKLQRGERRFSAEDRDHNDDRHDHRGKDDQEVPDIEHRALKVADGVRFLN